MTKGSVMELHARTQLPIAQLEPSINRSTSLIRGVVTLVWPYSSSTNSISVLLVEPDFRLRRNKGQVRITFRGSSAKAVARSGLNSGDGLVLGLEGVEWIKDEGVIKTPGRGVDWELRFGGRVILQFEQESKQPVLLDIDHPEPSPEIQALSPTLPISPPYNGLSHSPRLGYINVLEPQAWSSPAFLKRKHHVLEPFLNSAYDPFADEDEYFGASERKRTKFSRSSGQWRFTDRSPSPEKDLGVPTLDNTDQSGSAQRAHILEPREYLAIVSNVGSAGSPDAVIINDVGEDLPSPTINADEPPSLSVAAERFHEERSMSGGHVEEQGTMIETKRVVLASAASTEEVSEEACQDIGQTEQPPLQTTGAMEYQHTVVESEVSTPQAGTPLYINTTIATPDCSANDTTEHFETPDPPRLGPLLSPGLPLVSPLIDRKGRISVPFDAPDQYDLLAEPGGRAALVDSAISPALNEIPPVPSDEEEGRSIKIIESTNKGDIGKSVQSKPENALTPLEDSIPEIISTSQEDGVPTLKCVILDSGGEQLLEPTTGSPRMNDPPHVSDDNYGNQTKYGLDRAGSFRQQSLANGVRDLNEKWVRAEDGMADLQDSYIPDVEPASETESDSLFDGDTSSGEDLTIPDESLGLQPLSVDTSLDDLFEGSTVIFASSRSNSDIEGKGGPNKSVARDDDGDNDPVLDSNSEDTEEDSEEDSEEEEEQELEDIDSESAVSGEDVGSEELDVVYSPRALEIIATDSDKEDVGNLSEAHKLDDPMSDPTLPSDVFTQAVSVMEVHPPAETETNPPVIFSPTMQTAEVLSQLSSVSEEVNLVPTLEEELASSEHSVNVLCEQGPLVLAKQYVDDEATGAFSPIVGSEAGETPLLEDAQDLQNLVLDPRLRNQLATPDATQQVQDFGLASQESLHSAQQNRTLPTPKQSQNLLKDLATPSTPIIPQRPSLIERLKELRASSAGRARPANDLAPKIINPYTTTSQPESSVNSADESDADSVNHNDQAEERLINPPSLEPIKRRVEEEQYSAQVEATSISATPSPMGFRTPLAYFAALSSLSHHFNTITSILAISISLTTPTRAKSGPRDFHQAIYLVDPSSHNSSSTSDFTTAQIFRPYKDALPALRAGNAILLRNFKVQMQKGAFSLLSTDSSAWAVFSLGEEPQIRGPPVELGLEERGFAKGLGEWWESLEEAVKGPLLARAEEARMETEAKMRKQAKAKAKGKGKGKATPRKSFVDGMHELRDGTRWTHESEERRIGLHELRDGTVWRDTEE